MGVELHVIHRDD